ncbi:MAG: HAD family phosphatase [Eubacteriales bacterium]|nr:HAD family phosphatase [Eubacteriales bacterium]
MHSKKKGIIFDKDGTLFDTETMYNQIWFEMCEEEQYAGLNPDTIWAIKGYGGQKLVDKMQESEPDFNGQELIDEIFRRGNLRQSQNLPFKPGAMEMIMYAKEHGFKIAIASSSTHEQVVQNMKTAKIDSFVDAIVSGDDIKNGKPAPDSYLLATQMLELHPEECYAVEDSFHGICSAHTAGCFTILIPDLQKPNETFTPHYDDMSKDFFEVMEKMKKDII